MKIKIITPSRLHFALIDLSGDLGRVDGGVGVALNYPKIVLEASSLPNNDIIANNGYNSELIYDIAKNVFKHLEIDGGIEFNLTSSIPRHVGLGSKTQMSLAVAFAVNYLFNIRDTLSTRSDTLNGFWKKSTIFSCIHSPLLRASDILTTLIKAIFMFGICLTISSTGVPGIIISSNIRSGFIVFNFLRQSSPSIAVTTL